jgi:DNA repair protein RecO (recombination protein O)
MAHRETLEAVVLRTIDLGEADRFCILFTREIGRIAAKARSVRKLGSKLGGIILPFRHINIELSESDTHRMIIGAVDRGDLPAVTASFDTYLRLEQGIELLLALTEDNEPIPYVFDLLLQFIRIGVEQTEDPLPAFKLRLLHVLGFLPSEETDPRYRSLSAEAQAFVTACTKLNDLQMLTDLTVVPQELEKFAKIAMVEQLQRPLKASSF